MKNNLLTLVITLTLGIILCGSLLMPVISDAQHAKDVTYTNNAPYSYCKMYEFSDDDEDDTTVITVCKTGEHTVSVNGVSHNVSTYQPVIVSDGFSIRFFNSSMSFATPNGNNTVTSVTITISGGVATFSDVILLDETERSVDPVNITWAFIHDMSGDYSAIITESGATVYATKNGIYSANWINTTSEFFSIKAGSNVVTLTNSEDSSTTTYNWGGEYLDNGVYKMTLSSDSDDFTFVVDNAGADYTVHPFIVVVPKTITATPDSESAINALYGAIPILMIVSLVVVSIGAITVKNRD